MTTYFAPTGSGIGDVIVCLPVCEWLTAHSTEPVVLVARGPRQVNLSSVIPGLAGEVREVDLAEVMKPGDRFINLRDHPLQKHHDWFSEEFQKSYPDFRITEILSVICRDFNIPADLSAIKPFRYSVDERSRGKVILIPGTTVKVKMMRPHFWLNLYHELKDMGTDCLIVGLLERCNDIKSLVDAGVPHIETPSIEQAINLISSAQSVVAVDTGLMHIAVQQGVKTVAIHGKCEIYYRPAENCIPIYTNSFHRSAATKIELPNRWDACADGSEPQCDFPVMYDTWDWDPPGVEDGDYVMFDDHKRIIELLCPL